MWADGGTPAVIEPLGLAPSIAPAGTRKHIVVVDDDANTLALIERTLQDYRVSTARNGEEALAILLTQARVDLLITDYLMPQMTGDELTAHARQRRPDLPILVITGHANVLAAADPAWWQTEHHLSKPFQLGALRTLVEELIGPAEPSKPSDLLR